MIPKSRKSALGNHSWKSRRKCEDSDLPEPWKCGFCTILSSIFMVVPVQENTPKSLRNDVKRHPKFPRSPYRGRKVRLRNATRNDETELKPSFCSTCFLEISEDRQMTFFNTFYTRRPELMRVGGRGGALWDLGKRRHFL